MAFLLIQNWYSNERKLSPVAKNRRVSKSLFEEYHFPHHWSVLETNRGYHHSQFNNLS